jgi:hypothetical protein
VGLTSRRRIALSCLSLGLAVPSLWLAVGPAGADAVSQINTARSAEGLGAIELPADFDSEAISDQVVQIINDERSDRGLAPGYEITAFDPVVNQAATSGSDPPLDASTELAGAVELAGNWAAVSAGTPEPVELIDYEWMYNDGWNGAAPGATTNIACTGPTAAGCNGHRQNILTANPAGTNLYLDVGVANTTYNGQAVLSISVLFDWAPPPATAAAPSLPTPSAPPSVAVTPSPIPTTVATPAPTPTTVPAPPAPASTSTVPTSHARSSGQGAIGADQSITGGGYGVAVGSPLVNVPSAFLGR